MMSAKCSPMLRYQRQKRLLLLLASPCETDEKSRVGGGRGACPPSGSERELALILMDSLRKTMTLAVAQPTFL